MGTRHLIALLAAACAALAGAAACAAEEGPQPVSAKLPVTVRVTAASTYLRAGPSDDFYPTERLTSGHELEVWAVDPAGYCAVRPVAGSFSWLRACDVDAEAALATEPSAPQPRKEGKESFTAVVVTDGAVSRVGSQLNALRHVAQVQLEAGERVRVLEEVRIAEGRHAGLWVRIEPPAGEYRWVRCGDVSLPAELAPPKPIAAEAETAAAAAEALDALRDAGNAVAQVVTVAGEATAPAETAADSGIPQALNPLPTAKKLFAGWLPLGASVFDPNAPAVPGAVSAGAVAASGDELADIDLALSLAVTGPSDSWNLAPLRDRLRVAATRATTQGERTRAEAIDARLARFESVQARQRAIVAGPPGDPSPLRLGGMWSSLSAIGSRPVRPGVLPGGAPGDGTPTWTPPEQMETTGRLATVVSRRPDAPRWAVVDDANNVLAFVTPSPGMNLAPLVGQQVMVRGAKGYMPEYKRPYMVATEALPRLAATPSSPTDAIRQ